MPTVPDGLPDVQKRQGIATFDTELAKALAAQAAHASRQMATTGKLDAQNNAYFTPCPAGSGKR